MAIKFTTDRSLATQLDDADPIRSFRDRFQLPMGDRIYFLGNSLGLPPRSVHQYVEQIMDDWSQLGVEGFFHGKDPWMDYHDLFTKTLGEIVGALPSEVVVMNQLTVNLHLMMVSFYRPTKQRYKIICEAKAFPSDQYAFETHVRHHGFEPGQSIIEVSPRAGEHLLRTEDIIATIEQHGDETALVLFSGINYYTGQLFDMAAIINAAHAVGAIAGFDLAHAAGNVRLSLHDWGADFACWCSYKYLNSGPGAIGAAFIHTRHHSDHHIRFAGWWGYDKATRFKMEKGFKPMQGAAGWQLSTPSLLLYACHRASLELFAEAGWSLVLEKARTLNDYLWHLLADLRDTKAGTSMELITPADGKQRGCQLSMLMHKNGREVYDELTHAGLMVDWREPNVIRLAPVPLYNSFDEVWRFVDRLKIILNKLNA